MSRTTTRTLSGVGDPNAPVGSQEWLEYVVNYAKSTARDVSAKCGDLQKILRTMQECEAHKAAGFVSFETFLSRRVGISSDQAKAVLDAEPSVKVAAVLRPKAIVRAVEAKQAAEAAGVKLTTKQLAAVAECSDRTAASAMQKSSSLPENCIPAETESATTGLSTATIYRQRRLKADHPDLWAQVEAGDKSTHAAAIEAGIVKVPSVLEQLRKLWAKATDADRRTFMDEVTHG
jgi:hypothetical protein